jgi:hypothetical protein
MGMVGNNDAGFSVSFDPSNAAVRVVGWGFWPTELAQSLDKAVLSEYRAAPIGSKLVFDVSGLKPMRDEAQKAFVALLSVLKALGVPKVSFVVTTNHLTKLQFMRIATEAGLSDRVGFI